jgi:hypothetical protein
VDGKYYASNSQYKAALEPLLVRAEIDVRRGEFPLFQPAAQFAIATGCDLVLACWLTFEQIDGLTAVFLLLWIGALTVMELQSALKSFEIWRSERLNPVSWRHRVVERNGTVPAPPTRSPFLPQHTRAQEREPKGKHTMQTVSTRRSRTCRLRLPTALPASVCSGRRRRPCHPFRCAFALQSTPLHVPPNNPHQEPCTAHHASDSRLPLRSQRWS